MLLMGLIVLGVVVGVIALRSIRSGSSVENDNNESGNK
jgi:hypothetical protein